MGQDLTHADTELAYWRKLLTEQADKNPNLIQRLNPKRPLQGFIEKHLDPERRLHRILDVGSGPLTTIGRISPMGEIEITPVDILANEYQALLDELGIIAPDPPRAVAGEDLSAELPFDFYHLVLANNSLDHTSDPVVCALEMLRLVTAGGVVLLRHWKREGSFEGWRGMHQWDLDLVDEQFVIEDNSGKRCNLSRLVAGCAEQIDAGEDKPSGRADGNSKQLFHVAFRKIGESVPRLTWGEIA